MKKLPPVVKVYEVYNALADDRIVAKRQEAFVDDSDYAETYIARLHDDEVSSNGNVTIWQHYSGYLILAVWMKLRTLSMNWNILPTFAGINWRKRNTKHKNRHGEVIEEFLLECKEQGYACEDIRNCVQEALEAVAKLPYTIKDNRAPMIRKRMKAAAGT